MIHARRPPHLSGFIFHGSSGSARYPVWPGRVVCLGHLPALVVHQCHSCATAPLLCELGHEFEHLLRGKDLQEYKSLIRRLSDAWPSWQHSACSPSAQNKSARPGCQAGRQASQNATPTRSSPRHILSHTSISISTYILQSVSAYVYIDGKKQIRRKNKRARDRRADSRSLGYAQTPCLLGETLLHAYFHTIALSPEASGRERL